MTKSLHEPVFQFRRRVEFVETDMAGIVHFSNFYRFMEQAEHAFLRSLGLSVYMTEPHDGLLLTWPRVSASCDFASPARLNDELEIGVSLERVGRKAITYGFRFAVGDRLVATGKITAVCCDLQHDGAGLKSIEIPPVIMDMLTGAKKD